MHKNANENGGILLSHQKLDKAQGYLVRSLDDICNFNILASSKELDKRRKEPVGLVPL